MKRSLLISFCLLLCATTFSNPKCEFRATWLTTGFSIDWPKTRGVEAQQKELISKLDVMKAGNMNVVCLQVRSFCDAIYKSSYEPWADCLTGVRGQDPGYDPLAFAVEEAHKRGLELHVWVNPLRATSSGTLPDSDLLVQNAGKWLIKYNNSSFKGQIIDPGYPEAREYVIKVLMEIVNNYDIDGILMDDYFYAYGGTKNEDVGSRTNNPAIINQVDHNYNGDKLDDWRRANVDSLICNLYKEIQAVKPWVRFGMGPFGTWSNQNNAAYRYGIKLPEGVRGSDSYQTLYCNTVEWVSQGWVDYINPQLYWSSKSKNQPYEKLCKWWAKDVCEYLSNKLPNGKKVHFFPSQAAYQAFEQTLEGYSDGIEEIQRQLTINRNYLSSGYTGSVLFSTSDYLKMYNALRASHFQHKALLPAMTWKSKTTLSAPTNVTIKDTILSWQHPTAERFTVYAYPRGTKGIANRQLANVVVPTQEELWTSFKTASGLTSLGTLSEINTGDMVASCKTICTKLTTAEVQKAFSNTDWAWLKKYISDTQNAQIGNAVAASTVPELTDDLTVATWRYAIAAFFLQTQYTSWPYSADFTTAGQPSAWGPAYLGEDTGSGNNGGNSGDNNEPETSTTPAPEYLKAVVYGNSCSVDGWGDLSKQTIAIYSYDRYGVEHKSVLYEGSGIYEQKVEVYWELNGGYCEEELPTYITEDYIIPTPIKAGNEFVGWYKSQTFRGTPITMLTPGWKGTLYARWKEIDTAIPELSLTRQMMVYDLMGNYVGEVLPTNRHGVFIVIQGENKYKIIL